MKNSKYFSLIFCLLFLGSSCYFASPETEYAPRLTISLNEEWLVQTGESKSWEQTNVPHTPRIEPLVVNDQWQGTLIYKKNISADNPSKIYELEFEGVMHETEVYINGKIVTQHFGGYLPFVVDVTNYLNFNNPNELKVVVNNEDNITIPPGKSLNTLDFNYYGGIYRNVKLHVHEDIYITNPLHNEGGIVVHFDEASIESAKGTVQVHVRNDRDKKESFTIETNFISQDNKVFSFHSPEIELKANSDSTISINVEIENADLWSVRKANLYQLITTLKIDDKIVDENSQRVGIRKIKLSPKGFYLNGKEIFIKGTNRHQEYPYVGYAISKNANYRDAIKIKQAGFDFVRLSHYPQDESFLDACDELGILVMNAIPGWQYFGDSTFLAHSYQDIRDMVRRDRNHPSVVFWEVSLNESQMTDEYMIKANEILKEELPFDDTYSAGWMDHEAFDLYIPARQHNKAPEYWNNYRVNERPLFISEYGDWEYYAHNAGFNQSAYEGLKEEERTSRQLRAHGEKRLLQQAMNFQEAANSNRKGSNTIGHANWLMFDYNRGYANDIEASGISDIFRIPKFAHYFYKSQRAPDDTLSLSNGTGPMVKIASNWTKESNTKLTVFSNCEEVATYLNGELIDKKKAIKNDYSDQLDYPPFLFDVEAFRAGQLMAYGYIDGIKVVDDIVITPSNPKSIAVAHDLSGIPISSSENDIIFIYATILDENGTVVNDSNAEVTFSTNAGKIIGSNPVKAEAGIATVLLRTKPTDKNISIKASSSNLGLEKTTLIQ